MNQILSIFLPAVFGIYIYQNLNKKEITIKECGLRYLVFVLIINIISYAISIYIFGQPDFTFTNTFTMKYLFLSSLLAIVISFIISFLEKNMEINIRVEKK